MKLKQRNAQIQYGERTQNYSGYGQSQGHSAGYGQNPYSQADYSYSAPANVQLVNCVLNERLPSNLSNNCMPKVDNELHDDYKAFACRGVVHGANGVQREVWLVRDTGALQSVCSREVLQPSDYVDTHEVRLIQGCVGDPVVVSLVEVRLDSALVSGICLMGLVDKLPTGCAALIGNDLSLSNAAPVHVVTRASAKAKAVDGRVCGQSGVASDSRSGGAYTNVSPVVLSDAGMNVVHTDTNVDVLHTVDNSSDNEEFNSDNESDVGLTDLFLPDMHANVEGIVSREQLIKLQHEDVSLQRMFAAVDLNADTINEVGFHVLNGVLVRKWNDKFRPSGLAITQVIVPKCLRSKLLNVAHDIPLSGHLGTRKTIDRLCRHFYWPGINKDVKSYCRSCDVCQRLGKGAKVNRAPLINLPVISRPWSKISVDIVGPLLKCKTSGNRFILTVLDLATHYPLAFAIQNHTAVEVARCLIEAFTMFGFPDEILSDCGSEFMSDVMQVFLHECKVVHITCSPFHPQSNGALERLHWSVKNMLKAIVESFDGDWDQVLPWVLFAYREVPVAGVGFSPFDLMFGRDVKGPLQLIKNSWLRVDIIPDLKKTNVIDFVLDLRNKIRDSVKLANDNEQVAKLNSKRYYDRGTKEIEFAEGDKVLLLLPLVGKPLQAKYCGPYTVVQRLGPVDYVVSTPDRRKSQRVVHVNLMKRYITRDSLSTNDSLGVSNVLNVNICDNSISFVDQFDLKHLNESQRHDLLTVLFAFESVFSNKPGKTTLVKHAITLVDGAKPVHQVPYRMHPDKVKWVDAEIKSLLELGLIRESCSPWAAPILVVPKPDGSFRLCADFRKLNSVTVPDPFPMPRIETLIDRVGGARVMSKLDMTKGYYQIPMDVKSIPLTGFVTHSGHYEWLYLAFGLRNAPATFSALVKKVFAKLEEFSDAYLDDVICFSGSWQDHLVHLTKVLQRVKDAGLTLNPKKCAFANAEIDFLGHHLSLNCVRPKLQKVEVLLNFPVPKHKKQVQSLLGLASYYRKFLPHFADITLPLTQLLKKNVKFHWSVDCQKAFVDLKSRLASRPILRPPDYTKGFCLGVDASNLCVGSCLFQIVDGVEHPIAFLSRKLRKHEINYSTVEKEALSLVVAVKAFSVYFGSAPVVVYTDHSPLRFINSMRNSNQKLLRWSLELQQYSLDIRHRPGKDNVLPDLLSRPSLE